MIGNGDTVSVATEILEHILRGRRRVAGMTTQFLRNRGRSQAAKNLGCASRSQIPGKMQLASLKGQLESVDELARKHRPEHGNGEKEARVRSNPAGVIEREPPAGTTQWT